MKKGINIWAYGKKPLAEAMREAEKTGFEGIELSYSENEPIGPQSTPAEMKALARQAQEIGIEITSLVAANLWKYNMVSESAEERGQCKTHLLKSLELAAALGAASVLVIPGFTGPFQAGAPVVSDYDAAFARAVETLRQAAPRAEELGVNMAVENVWNKFLGSPIEMRELIDQVGSPRACAYFDVGNIMRVSYPEHWIRALGKRIACVHFKDYRVGVGTLDGFVELLQGDVDFRAVMAALREVGYQGYAIAEMFPTKLAVEAVPARAKQAMDAIFQM